MSIMQVLLDSQNTGSEAYMDFLYRYNPKKRQLFAFYEGDEDASYYGSILRTRYEGECVIEEIIAGCKSSVLKVLREFNWDVYTREQVCFFVDKDLDFWLEQEHISDSNLFVTDGYSVENYLVSREMFHILMTQIKGFGRASKIELDSIIYQFTGLLDVFRDKMMRVMAICVLAKIKDSNISLSDYSLNNALSFDLLNGGVALSLSDIELDKVKAKWGIDSENSVNSIIGLFKNTPKEYHVRGKWLLQFMISCGEFIRKQYAVFSPSLKVNGRKRLRPICEISPTKAVPVLGPRCHNIPTTLDQFLMNNYGQYLLTCTIST